MENYNQTSGKGSPAGQQSDQQKVTQNNKENQVNSNEETTQQEEGKKPVYIKDMPEIKPETNQGGL